MSHQEEGLRVVEFFYHIIQYGIFSFIILVDFIILICELDRRIGKKKSSL